jgi:hypothetical protein
VKPDCPVCQLSANPRPRHTADQLREFHPGSNPDCPACQESRLHTADERTVFHFHQELKP